MKYFFFLILFFTILITNSQEQLFQDNTRLVSDLEKVENLIHQKIDSLRAKKKLVGLTKNNTLAKAAKSHADWMSETGKFSHIQNKSKSKTPQKRVELVGGNSSFIGENIAYTLFNIEMTNKKGKRYTNTTYESIASDLVEMWRLSKGHYKNIITKEFKTTGIALAIDFEMNKVYAVQVFGGE